MEGDGGEGSPLTSLFLKKNCAKLLFFHGTWSQSSQLAEPLWTDPGLKSGVDLRQLNPTLKKKSAGGEWIVEHSPKIFAREVKATTTTTN